MVFSSLNTLKIIVLSGLYLSVLCFSVSDVYAQEQTKIQSNTQDPITPASTSQQLSANNSQRAEVFAALSALNKKYKDIAQRIPLAPLLKDPSKRFEDGEALIFSIIVDNLKLGELYGYKNGTGMRFGLNEFATALDFTLTSNEDFTEFTGWYIKEDNTFSLMINTLDTVEFEQPRSPYTSKATVMLRGQELKLSHAHYQLELDDLYIDLTQMARWFNLDIEYDFINLKIILHPNTQLPVQAKLARRNKRDNSNNNNAANNALQDNHYQLLSPQVIDLSINSKVNKNNASTNYSLLGARDFAFMRSEFYAYGNDKDLLQDGRVTFSKNAHDKPMLNGLISAFEIGDITPVRSNNLSTGLITRGVSFTNRGDNEDNINVTSFKGNIQIGWDVELYRNGILIDSIFDVQDGRYDFNDIQLYYGKNTFALVFYGPQGQIRRETVERLVTTTLQSNNGIYSFSINDLDNTVLNLRDINTDTQGYLASGSYESRITDTVSYRASVSQQFAGRQDSQSGFLSLNALLPNNVLFNSTIEADSNKTRQFSTNVRTSFAKQSLLTGFTVRESNEAFDQARYTLKSFRSELSGVIQFARSPSISYQTRFRKQADSFNKSETEFTINLGTRLWDTSFNTGLNYVTQRQNDSSKSSVKGLSLNIQRTLGPTFINIQSLYDMDAHQLTSIGSQISYDITNSIKSRFRFTQDLIKQKTAYSINLNWRHDDFYFTSDYSYSDLLGWQLGLGLKFGMGYISDSQDFIVNRASMTSSGTVLANVFLDNNMTGQFDEGDEWLPNVQVRAAQAFRQSVTDSNGQAVITGLPNNKITDIDINRDSLPDPFMKISQVPFALRGRSGYIERVDVPVVYTSEIDGTISTVNQFGNQQQIAYAPVQLRDLNGNIVQTVNSEFDGYYLIMDVLPGQYQISLAPAYIEKKNIIAPEPINVVLSSQGELSGGNDFTLVQQHLEERFIVSLGKFTNMDVLHAFWQVIFRNHMPTLSQFTPFYYRENRENQKGIKVHLGIDLYGQRYMAERSCQLLNQTGINCEIIDYTIAISRGTNNEKHS